MKRRAFIQASVGMGLLAQLPSHASSVLHWETSIFQGLGTTLSIRAAHSDVLRLRTALAAARACVAQVEDQMSLFRSTSAISQLNREGVLLQPHSDLHRVLQISQRIASRSQGAFDITVQPLWTAYVHAQKQGRLPTAAEIQTARQRTGWQNLEISPARIAFKQPGMGITLNGIAQGFAADRVRQALKQHGVAHALINTGEWSSIGKAEGDRDWTLGISDPHQATHVMARLPLLGLCMATSADDQCTFSADRQHHHILNPATGYSPRDISSVTVLAKSCTQADALTKVLFVGGYERALHIANAWQVDALVVHKDGRWKTTHTLSQQLIA
jgi:thiamine biosynthesis lipoprotein